MSSRPDGQPRRHALTPDDDWFAAPSPRRDEWFAPEEDLPFDQEEPAWHDDDADDGHDAPQTIAHALGDRRFAPLVAAAGIVVAIVVAVVVVRSLGGSDSGTATTAALTDTTAIETTAIDTTAIDTTAQPTPNPATTPTTSTPTTSTPATTTPKVGEVPAGQSLKPGMSGSSVLALQQALAQLGYDPGTPDGSYGPSTTQAVTAFQQANNLTQDGIAGPATLEAINAQLARG